MAADGPSSDTTACERVSPPPPLPPALHWFLLGQGIVVGFGTLAIVVYRFIAPIIGGCFFSFAPKDFDTFKETGRVCDANFGVNFWISFVVSAEMQFAIVGGLVPFMRSTLAVMVSFSLQACWQVVRVAHLITFALLPLPFWSYVFPATLITGIGLITLLSVGFVFHMYLQHEASEKLRIESLRRNRQNGPHEQPTDVEQPSNVPAEDTGELQNTTNTEPSTDAVVAL